MAIKTTLGFKTHKAGSRVFTPNQRTVPPQRLTTGISKDTTISQASGWLGWHLENQQEARRTHTGRWIISEAQNWLSELLKAPSPFLRPGSGGIHTKVLQGQS